MRRDSTTDACTQMQSFGGRRLPFFLLSDQVEEDQYIFTSIRFDPHAKSCKSETPCKEARKAYLFKYHYDRLIEAASHRGWYEVQKGAGLKRPIDLWQRISYAVETEGDKSHKGAYKVKVIVRYHGNIETHVTSDLTIHKQPLLYPTSLELFKHPHSAATRYHHFKVVLDALPTNRSLHTKDKTEWRHMYDYARVGAGIQSFQDAKEVLLFNADGEIMDVS